MSPPRRGISRKRWLPRRAHGDYHPARRAGAKKEQVKPSEPRPFKIGDRVKLSAVGRKRSPRMSAAPGTIIGLAKTTSSAKVLFDERKTANTLHFSYLELADAELGLKAKK